MRVLLRDMPLMLHDVLADALAKQPGVELIDEPSPPELRPPTAPDVVIVGTQDPDTDDAPELLKRWPHSRVVLIATSGQRASLVQLRPQRTRLGGMSLAELLRVVTGGTS